MEMKKDKKMIALLAAVVLIFAALVIYCIVLAGELKQARQEVDSLDEQLQAIKDENDQYEQYNEELEEKVSILSDTVNDKVQQEEEREAQEAQSSVPTGFPLKGQASYDEDDTELDGNPITYFEVSVGTGVIATANGTVSSIAGDSSNGYIIMVDHGNGYFSVYRNGSSPKVNEGDEVTRATELFVIEEGHERLGYQIIQDEQYINPLDLMELYG